MSKQIAFVWGLLILVSCKGIGGEIALVKNQTSAYTIVIPKAPSKLETRSASVLQKYLKEVTGATLPVVSGDAAATGNAIFIGHTQKGDRKHPERLPDEGYLIQTLDKDLVIMGGSGKGLIYGVYSFLGKYAGCHKISNCPAVFQPLKDLKLPELNIINKPLFEYRECYFPASNDAEFLEWNQLQRFEDLWGPHAWGHTFDKLVPAKKWFATHPEYYALVKGKRQATQLCLANEDVFKQVVSELKKAMADNPDAMYWSVSPNDDIGYCECDKCKAVDEEQGSPSGSLVKFVNRVAEKFPGKKITTLAYGYTHKAPKTLKPAANVYIFLSDIDAFREHPLGEERSAAAFRYDLKMWGGLTHNLFVWDYLTEFTNYLAPFPNLNTLQANVKFLRDNGVKGIFAQGSGDTYSDMAELKCYLQARLMVDDQADVKKLATEFVEAYYGTKASVYVLQYINQLQSKMESSGRQLDIYGNPVNEWKSYLSPAEIDAYSEILDKAEIAADGNATYLQRIMQLRLPLDYTVLQQSRFFGIEKFGIFLKGSNDAWYIKPRLEEKVKKFVANCKVAGATELAEGGKNPDQYQEEWNAIFKAGVTPTKAIGAKVTLQHPNADDYPAKGTRTLVDGNPGYTDFSYNWLCFYGVPMVATIDLGKPMKISTIKMHFLDDPRHWIFLPSKVKIEVSEDGNHYKNWDDASFGAGEEHYEVNLKEYNASKTPGTYQYIKVTAENLPALPLWRARDGKKPMLACDEIFVQ